MCYNIAASYTQKKLELRFKAPFERLGLFKPIYHASAFAHPRVPVITGDRPSIIQLYDWGLIPSWVKDEEAARKIRQHTANARAESVRDKPSFRTSIRDKRCLILVDGFYEWQEVNRAKYPYLIYRTDREPFALAGLWDQWHNPATGELTHTFSVITTRANALLEKIHNTKKRMPVILAPSAEHDWIDPATPSSDVDRLMAPLEDRHLTAHPVSKLITARDKNSNVPAVMRGFHYEALDAGARHEG